MKTVLDVFGKFNEIDSVNSRFGSKHNAIHFYPADGCVLVYLAVNHFEVLTKRDGCGEKWQDNERRRLAFHAAGLWRLCSLPGNHKI
jgi:hypothetical protein